jgi:hypothetical protein
MKEERTITWQYATNFTENEKRWEELRLAVEAVCRVYSKNTLLQFKFMNFYLDMLEMHSAIGNGDRSEFLFKKTQEAVEESAKLEEVGKIMINLFLQLKNTKQ